VTRLALILLLGLFPTLAGALEPFDASYRLLYNGELKGEARFSLRITDQGYRFKAVTRPAGAALSQQPDHEVLESSHGHFDGGHPEPDAYYYAVKSNGETRMVEIFFDWKKMELLLRGDESQERYRLEEGTQDRLSYLLRAMALADDLRAEAAFPRVASDGTERIVLHRKLRRYLDTPAGRFLGQEITISSGESRPTRHLWLAAKRGWLPLVLEHRDGDAVVRMELTRIHQP